MARSRCQAPPASSPPRRHGWRRKLGNLLLAGCGAGLWLAQADLAAQGRKPAPTLVVASQLWLKPGTETPFEVRAVPGEAVPPSSVIVIRGVPEGMRFSEGRQFGAGVWVLPAVRLPSLKLHTPTDITSGGMLTIILTGLDGVPLAQTQVTVISLPPGTEEPPAPPPAPSPGSALAAAPVTPPPQNDPPTSSTAASEPTAAPAPAPAPAAKAAPENRPALLMLLDKGKESLRHGNILIARQFFERAATKGLAEAALALATTYDPRELPRMTGGADVVPDAAIARKWYEKARELGSPDAAARLSELGRR
jgi:hypothetical protein